MDKYDKIQKMLDQGKTVAVYIIHPETKKDQWFRLRLLTKNSAEYNQLNIVNDMQIHDNFDVCCWHLNYEGDKVSTKVMKRYDSNCGFKIAKFHEV